MVKLVENIQVQSIRTLRLKNPNQKIKQICLHTRAKQNKEFELMTCALDIRKGKNQPSLCEGCLSLAKISREHTRNLISWFKKSVQENGFTLL